MRYDWISFTTDYGTVDGFVAACHGVIARIAPRARVLDVTHAVPPQDVRRGALVLAQTVPFTPEECVHLAVVDPGVGTARKGVVVVTARGLLVGPDNGVLSPAAEVLGGVRAAYELAAPEYRLPEVAATFHGRDIFAPAAAHLALGVAPERFGPRVCDLVRLPDPLARVEAGLLRTEVIGVDHFGNAQLAATPTQLTELGLSRGDRVRAEIGGAAWELPVCTTFADVQVGDAAVITDSAGYLAVVVNGGSAAGRFAVATGTIVGIAPEPAQPPPSA